MTPTTRPFDAFLSYAHEDQATVSWLHEVLTGYWVPGKRRRRVSQDRRQITARSLDAQIENALDGSRYLIVCWSGSIADPRQLVFPVSDN